MFDSGLRTVLDGVLRGHSVLRSRLRLVRAVSVALTIRTFLAVLAVTAAQGATAQAGTSASQVVVEALRCWMISSPLGLSELRDDLGAWSSAHGLSERPDTGRLLVLQAFKADVRVILRPYPDDNAIQLAVFVREPVLLTEGFLTDLDQTTAAMQGAGRTVEDCDAAGRPVGSHFYAQPPPQA